jgi:NitT/TauT family transport system substrate-binding protein
MFTMKRALFFTSFILFLAVACRPEDPSAPADGQESVSEIGSPAAGLSDAPGQQENEWPESSIRFSLPMGYIPDPQYAPYYVAVEKGYYAEEGFDVDFNYSFETDGLALVGAGEVPFAIVSGEQVILARAQDIPVVYILEWFQRFPIAVISKSNSGIEETSDLEGRRVGIPGFFGASYVGIAGLLAANDLSLEDIEPSDIGFTQVESLMTDQVEAVVGYANNEPLQLDALGQPVNVIYVADEADMVANGLITSEETIRNNPDMVAAFVRATLRGLSDTISDPEKAYEISKLFVEGLDDSRRNVLDASIEMWSAGTLGQTELDSWQRTQEALLQIGFLDAPVEDLEAAFTNAFIQDNQP